MTKREYCILYIIVTFNNNF